ncbi:MAG: 50S ribosomal protein L11 methyltransferase [Desulfovibrio sp.]
MPTLLKVEITLPELSANEAEAFFGLHADEGWEEIRTSTGMMYRFHIKDIEAGKSFAQESSGKWPNAPLNVEEIEEEEWGLAWKDFFVPVSCGERFEILPPWLENDGTEGKDPIIIEPKMAFGTGHHATTSLCLAALTDLVQSGRIDKEGSFFDLGTGSGILAIGLAKLGMHGIGSDIDAMAIDCAKENLVINNVPSGVELSVASVEAAEGRKFDLMVANILSGPLIQMAQDIIDCVADGGCLVLSGILTEQAPAVVEAYQACGLSEPVIKEKDEWCSLVWC